MKSISQSRMFYHWRLAKRGGTYLVGSLASACAAGLFFLIAAPRTHWAPSLGPPPLWLIGGFVALLLISGLLWWRFSSLQDEMFHRVQSYSYGWGAVLTVAVLIGWGVANLFALAPTINPIAPVLIFALAKSFFWTRATRKWL